MDALTVSQSQGRGYLEVMDGRYGLVGFLHWDKLAKKRSFLQTSYKIDCVSILKNFTPTLADNEYPTNDYTFNKLRTSKQNHTSVPPSKETDDTITIRTTSIDPPHGCRVNPLDFAHFSR